MQSSLLLFARSSSSLCFLPSFFGACLSPLPCRFWAASPLLVCGWRRGRRGLPAHGGDVPPLPSPASSPFPVLMQEKLPRQPKCKRRILRLVGRPPSPHCPQSLANVSMTSVEGLGPRPPLWRTCLALPTGAGGSRKQLVREEACSSTSPWRARLPWGDGAPNPWPCVPPTAPGRVVHASYVAACPRAGSPGMAAPCPLAPGGCRGGGREPLAATTCVLSLRQLEPF